MTDLCLELREKEQVSYTVRDVEKACRAIIYARCVAPGTIRLICEGPEGKKEVSEHAMVSAGEVTPQATVAEGEWKTVTVCVSRGCVQIDEVEFDR